MTTEREPGERVEWPCFVSGTCQCACHDPELSGSFREVCACRDVRRLLGDGAARVEAAIAATEREPAPYYVVFLYKRGRMGGGGDGPFTRWEEAAQVAGHLNGPEAQIDYMDGRYVIVQLVQS